MTRKKNSDLTTVYNVKERTFFERVSIMVLVRDYVHGKLCDSDSTTVTRRPFSVYRHWIQANSRDEYFKQIGFCDLLPVMNRSYIGQAFAYSIHLKPFSDADALADPMHHDQRIWQIFQRYKFSGSDLFVNIIRGVTGPDQPEGWTSDAGTSFEAVLYLLILGKLKFPNYAHHLHYHNKNQTQNHHYHQYVNSSQTTTNTSQKKKRCLNQKYPSFNLSNSSLNVLARAIQHVVRAWDCVARILHLQSAEQLTAPYLLFDNDIWMYRALGPHEGFAPDIQACSFHDEDEQAHDRRPSYSLVRAGRSTEAHAALRHLTEIFVSDLNTYVMCDRLFETLGTDWEGSYFIEQSNITTLNTRFDECIDVLRHARDALHGDPFELVDIRNDNNDVIGKGNIALSESLQEEGEEEDGEDGEDGEQHQQQNDDHYQNFDVSQDHSQENEMNNHESMETLPSADDRPRRLTTRATASTDQHRPTSSNSVPRDQRQQRKLRKRNIREVDYTENDDNEEEDFEKQPDDELAAIDNYDHRHTDKKQQRCVTNTTEEIEPSLHPKVKRIRRVRETSRGGGPSTHEGTRMMTRRAASLNMSLNEEVIDGEDGENLVGSTTRLASRNSNQSNDKTKRRQNKSNLPAKQKSSNENNIRATNENVNDDSNDNMKSNNLINNNNNNVNNSNTNNGLEESGSEEIIVLDDVADFPMQPSSTQPMTTTLTKRELLQHQQRDVTLLHCLPSHLPCTTLPPISVLDIASRVCDVLREDSGVRSGQGPHKWQKESVTSFLRCDPTWLMAIEGHVYGVYVSASRIRPGQQGLFATRVFRPGDIIAPMHGAIVYDCGGRANCGTTIRMVTNEGNAKVEKTQFEENAIALPTVRALWKIGDGNQVVKRVFVVPSKACIASHMVNLHSCKRSIDPMTAMGLTSSSSGSLCISNQQQQQQSDQTGNTTSTVATITATTTSMDFNVVGVNARMLVSRRRSGIVKKRHLCSPNAVKVVATRLIQTGEEICAKYVTGGLSHVFMSSDDESESSDGD